jgi:stage III sporulation protein AH
MKFSFTIIKKNHILAVAIILMLIVAGYLNYTYNPNNVYDVELTGVIDDNLGDAVFVDSKNIETNLDNLITDSSSITNETAKNIVKNNESVEYFINTRMERSNMFAEQLEIYEKMLRDNKVEQKQKEVAQEEIKKLNDTKNAIMVAENMIKLKGFDDVIILNNNESINVVVKENDKLTQTEVAQIQNIINRELKANIENIHIMSK